MADSGVAAAAICRAVLLGRGAAATTAAAGGLLVVEQRWRVVAVLLAVAVATIVEVSLLTRWPAVVRRPWTAALVDLLPVLAILGLSRGGMAYFWFVAGSAALAGALLGLRAVPIWVGQAGLSFAVVADLLRAYPLPPELTAYLVVFPTTGVLAGLGAAAATSALERYVDLAVQVARSAQRSAAASERARLARELHDSVTKTLRGVSFAALALPASLRRSPALAEHLAATVSAGAAAAAREARQLITGLRVDAPDRAFAATVPLICRRWAVATSIRVDVDVEPVEPPVAQRYELTRILQEALTNVEQHAHARWVGVRVRRTGDAVELVVRDDGIGFGVPHPEALHAAGRLGIVGMRERARNVGGTLTVASQPGVGTSVVATAPLTEVPR